MTKTAEDPVLEATKEDALRALADRGPNGMSLRTAISTVLENDTSWEQALEGTSGGGYWRDGVETILENPGDYVEG